MGIAARVSGQHIEISVTDSGSGIPQSKLESIFELFAQLPRSPARSDGGLGIGLTLARRIIDMQRGSIAAHSAGLDQCTEFVVRLALAAPATASAAATSHVADCESAKARCRILLVDDHADGREAIGTLLQIYGYDVQFAHDGKSALAAAATFKPTIVILDIGPPDMDGYEVARRLRAGQDAPEAS